MNILRSLRNSKRGIFMKQVFAVLSIISIAFVGIAVQADEAQSMPKTTNTVLQKNQNALLKATVIRVVDGEQNGVLAYYETLLVGAKLDSTTVMVRSGNKWTEKQSTEIKFQKIQKNENNEVVFIVGLKHETLTDDASIFHVKASFFTDYKPCLMVWPIGIEKIKLGDRDARLKKFTVNPDEALKFFSSTEQNPK